MTPQRIAVVLALSAIVAALTGWQWHRERMVRACVARGGSWDGGACGPPRIRPILRRDLQRS
jgi:hypothetical protein